MRLEAVVDAARRLADTRSRLTKRAVIADLLNRADEADDLELAALYLSGTLRQRRTGVGHRSLRDLPAPAGEPGLTLASTDAALEHLAGLTGPGSAVARREAVADLMARATADEQQHLVALLTGNVRQGALDSVLLDGIAEAFEVDPEAVRRAAFLGGSTAAVATAAAATRRTGVDHLVGIRLEVGRAVRPMLASSAPDVGEAFAVLGGEVFVDAKLDGIRLQVHRDGDHVRLFSRSLQDVTDRFPEVVVAARRFQGAPFVLDGEVLAMRDGRPAPFQVSASRGQTMTAYFFDALAVAGRSLVDEPAHVRSEALAEVVPQALVVPRERVSDEAAARRFFERTLAAGHEGVVVKDPRSAYAAGRRGASWIKVKPRHTFDLVVLAVEWGSGRRRGLLSNIHLGARDGRTGELVMVGKTFKGMTDELLAWQTRRFGDLAVSTDRHVVTVRPEQVVEVAVDGVQSSSRYPGGVALRFARVLRYRTDKTAGEADTLDALRRLGPEAT